MEQTGGEKEGGMRGEQDEGKSRGLPRGTWAEELGELQWQEGWETDQGKERKGAEMYQDSQCSQGLELRHCSLN